MVVGNLQKAQKTWARMLEIMGKEWNIRGCQGPYSMMWSRLFTNLGQKHRQMSQISTAEYVFIQRTQYHILGYTYTTQNVSNP